MPVVAGCAGREHPFTQNVIGALNVIDHQHKHKPAQAHAHGAMLGAITESLAVFDAGKASELSRDLQTGRASA